MYQVQTFFLIAMSLLLISCSSLKQQAATEERGYKALYITSVGWFHDYQQQILDVRDALENSSIQQMDVLVGEVESLKSSEFWQGYDLLIYNFCHAAHRDPKLIDNLIRPVKDGIPLMALHCSMHSFQFSPSWHGFLGLKTLRHEHQRQFEVETVNAHEITKNLPNKWSVSSDELYITENFQNDITPLISAYGVETKRRHIQAWINSSHKGQIFASTLGHHGSSYKQPKFKRLLAGAANYLTEEKYQSNNSGLKLNMLSKTVDYPDKNEQQCVIQNMFRIGGEAVARCIESNCSAQNAITACEEQCRRDNPWPIPESLWPLCQAGQLSISN